MSANSFFMTPKGVTHKQTLNDFVNSHELTSDEFMSGQPRSAHANGGNVESVGTMPDWAQGQPASPQEKNTGGEISFEWGGGSDNYRVRKKEGGEVASADNSKRQIMELYGSIFR